tara:strand:- start:672 stop:1436 length:765 start_codon:yes stop_codon:yes gene_type:complete
MGNKESISSNAQSGRRGGNPRQVRKRVAAKVQQEKVKKGKKEIQDKIDRERYGAGVAYGSGKISKDKINKVEMFGGKASKYTNQYLESIGEAKKGRQYADGSYSYLLTSKGKQMKYGKSNSAMGSGDKSGIMTSIPISQRMHDSQMKAQALMVGGLSLLAGPIGGTIMRASAADSFNKIGSKGYQKYQKSFKANMNKDMSSSVQNNTSTANKAMGETTQVTSNKKKNKSTTKSTSKFFAGMGMDESSNKRTFYS